MNRGLVLRADSSVCRGGLDQQRVVGSLHRYLMDTHKYTNARTHTYTCTHSRTHAHAGEPYRYTPGGPASPDKHRLKSAVTNPAASFSSGGVGLCMGMGGGGNMQTKKPPTPVVSKQGSFGGENGWGVAVMGGGGGLARPWDAAVASHAREQEEGRGMGGEWRSGEEKEREKETETGYEKEMASKNGEGGSGGGEFSDEELESSEGETSQGSDILSGVDSRGVCSRMYLYVIYAKLQTCLFAADICIEIHLLVYKHTCIIGCVCS